MEEATPKLEPVFKPSPPVLGFNPAGGDRPPLLPLLLTMECCASQQEMNSNVEATIARGYTPFSEYLNKYSGTLSICGSAPSLGYTYRDLTGDVMAINNALKFLLEKGVVPKFAMFWDAAEVVEQFAIPHPEVIYFVGARCHPKVFERLKDCKVVVWYAGGDHNINDFMLEKGIGEPMVNGGSAGVTRGMYLGYAIGYHDAMHIHGADSSYSDEGKTHVNESVVPEKDFRVWVGNHEGNQQFRTTPEWCGQVEEMKLIYTMFSNMLNVKLKVHGTGMLPHVVRIMQHREREMGPAAIAQRLNQLANSPEAHQAATQGATHANAGE